MGHYGKVIVSRDDLNVLDCEGCGFAHLHPMGLDTDKYYVDDRFYREHSPINWLQKEVDEYVRGSWDAAFAYQLDFFRDDLPMLDVGSSTGVFLRYWNERRRPGWGIEPSRMSNRIAEHFGIRNYLDLAAFRKFADRNSIDRVHVRMSLVLEHVPNPLKFLKEYVEIANGGQIMIIVPNEFNPLQNRLHGNWFVSPVHLNYFTPSTLGLQMALAGIRNLQFTATFPMELAAVMGYRYIGNDERGRKLHEARLLIEEVLGTRVFGLYHYLFEKYGWGREIIAVGDTS